MSVPFSSSLVIEQGVPGSFLESGVWELKPFLAASLGQVAVSTESQPSEQTALDTTTGEPLESPKATNAETPQDIPAACDCGVLDPVTAGTLAKAVAEGKQQALTERPKIRKGRRIEWLEESLQLYIGRASGMAEELTREDEAELAKRIEVGRAAEKRLLSDNSAQLNSSEQKTYEVLAADGKEAFGRFVQVNLLLVVSIAGKYTFRDRGSLTAADLIAEGNIGLIRAVGKFDWRKGTKFSTYATWWIRQAIQEAMDKKARSIYLPKREIDYLEGLTRLERRHLDNGGELNKQFYIEATERLGINTKKMNRIRQESLMQPSSYDAPINPHGGDSTDHEPKIAHIADSQPDPVFDVVAKRTVRREILDALSAHLTNRQYQILALRWGIHDGEERGHTEVAGILGVSSSLVRMTEQRAFTKLRECAPHLRTLL